MAEVASVLSLFENAVWRDENGRATSIRIIARDDQTDVAEFELKLDPSDPLEGLIRDAIERNLDAPYLGSARYGRAVEAISQRGYHLSSALTQMLGRDGVRAKSVLAINLIGSAVHFDQMWEALLLDGELVPFSITRPVVRVVSGATPYFFNYRSDGFKVDVITARLNWSTDIPPRQITRPLRDLQADGKEFGIGVITPAFPNEIQMHIVPVPGVDDPDLGPTVLHIDAHGILLSYETLVGRYGAERADFERESWGLEIAPYEGHKSFILINSVSSNGDLTGFPVSGEELGALCRRASIALVVLNACRAASADAEGGVAVDLIKAGVPDVIAFRHKVKAERAVVFVSALYRALSAHLPVAHACCAARAALYRSGIVGETTDALPFPDWISLVHYSSRQVAPVEPPQHVVDLDLEFSQSDLPAPLEWAVFKIQELIYKMRLSEFAPADSGLPSRRPLLLFGPIGAGGESLLMETAGWLANTDLQISGATLFDVGNGIAPALEYYFEDFDLSWSDDEIVRVIIERWGTSHAVGFFNFDLALDRGAIDAEEYQRIFRLGETLARRIALCLAHSSRDAHYKRFAHAFGVDVLAFKCWPIATTDIKNWLFSGPALGDDPKNRIITYLLAWITAGHVDIAAVVRGCTSSEREILLDFFVFGTRLQSPPDELWILQQQVQARWAVIRREIDLDPLLPVVAGIGSGITTDELSMVGQSVRGQDFPLIPRLTLDQLLPLQEALLRASLMSEYTDKGPWGWADKHNRYAALLLNPLVRPLARINLASGLLDELDRWTVAWATDKLHFWSRKWIEGLERPQASFYLEHAWPLFAIAIWLGRRGGPGSRDLLAAIDLASNVGWWPHELDLTPLFGNMSSADAPPDQSEFERLWERALNQQQHGYFEKARDLLLLAIKSLDGETASNRYFAAHYRLGTLCLDLNDLDGAAEHLKIAEDGMALGIFPDMMAHIYYEQGVLAGRNGHEDRAQERFKSSIAQAQKLGLDNLLCLNFQELTDFELRQVPVIVQYGSPSCDIVCSWDKHITQAELYLRSARSAMERAGVPTPEEGTLLLLEARILAARARIAEAQEKALAAIAAYLRWEDHREIIAENFLNLLTLPTAHQQHPS